jgi:hypothetical protein
MDANLAAVIATQDAVILGRRSSGTRQSRELRL